MHDSLAVAAFLDPTILKWQRLLRGCRGCRRANRWRDAWVQSCSGGSEAASGNGEGLAASMTIRGSAPTLASTKTSPVFERSMLPNTKVGVDVDSARFFELLIGRLAGK